MSQKSFKKWHFSLKADKFTKELPTLVQKLSAETNSIWNFTDTFVPDGTDGICALVHLLPTSRPDGTILLQALQKTGDWREMTFPTLPAERQSSSELNLEN
jgi:hypothetical protein